MLKVNEGRAGEEDWTIMEDDGGAKSGRYLEVVMTWRSVSLE